MTTIRKITTSQIDGNDANTDNTSEIRPYGEIGLYQGNNNKLELLISDGQRTHFKSKVLAKGTFYGGDADSADGNNYDTIKLIPDVGLVGGGSDQYIIVDPTAPGHVHLRAGGTIDNSNADLMIGGENSYVRINSGSNPPIQISSNSKIWTFGQDGSLTVPGPVQNENNLELKAGTATYTVQFIGQIDNGFGGEPGATLHVTSIINGTITDGMTIYGQGLPSEGLVLNFGTVMAPQGDGGIGNYYLPGANYLIESQTFNNGDGTNNTWTFTTTNREFISPNGATIGAAGEGFPAFYNTGTNNPVVVLNKNIDSGADVAGITLQQSITSDNGGLASVVVAATGVDSYEYWHFKDTGVLELGSGGLKFSDNTTQNTAPVSPGAVDWTANHTTIDGTRYLVNDIVYSSGTIYRAKLENESLPVTDDTYWESLGSGYRLNIDGRDIPNIPYPVEDIVAGTNISVTEDPTGTFTINASNDIALDTLEPDGFVNRTDSQISFNDSSREFTISPKSPATSYAIYNNGLKVVKSSTETVALPNTTALYYIHFDKSDNSLSYKTTGFDFSTDIPIAQIYYNTDSGKAVYFGEERHGIRMDAATHKYLHNVFGTQYINGLSISNYTLSGDGSSNSDAIIAISDGLIYDEDIEANIAHSDTPNDPFEQILYPIAQLPVYYKAGASAAWTDTTANNYPVKTGTTIQYNLNTGGTWTPSDSPNPNNNRYIAYWICATTQENAPVISIMGQRIDSSLEQAQSNNSWGGLDLTGLPIVELRPLYRLIYDTKSTFTNTPRGFLVDILDIRSHIDTVTGLTQNDHGSLYGLADDDHSQYVHIDNARTISAVHTFTDGFNVGNLNVDGNTIISTDTNGNIAITPNGTGEVDISKVDIDGGSIDGAAIGANSASTGKFTQLYPTVVNNGSVSGSVGTDVSTGQIFDMTLTGATTLNLPTNPVDGVTIRWRITQDGTGGHSVSLHADFVIPSSASSPLPWSTAANATDILAATYHATRAKWDVVAFVPGY